MLEALIIQKTLRVPAVAGPVGDGATAARQFDAALLSVGFKASGDLLTHLSALDPGTVIDTAVTALAAVRRLVGDHVEHNVYFKDFPANVPDTMEFWLGLLSNALVHADGTPIAVPLGLAGVNLLALPGYGAYQHSYADMAAAHDDLIPADTDRVTVLHLGGTAQAEASALYAGLAASTTPLGEDDLELLGLLAALCADGPQPESIPVRENRALINRVRLAHGKALLADTVTDVLRVACALSGGDVTLEQPTRFVSLARRDRRAFLAALDGVVAGKSHALEDVAPRREEFKRLGERLHPHEYPQFPCAAQVFAVARGEQVVRSLASRVESAFGAGDTVGAVKLLANAPGMLLRSVDRVARVANRDDAAALTDAVRAASGRTSGRVLLSLREHLDNRAALEQARIFVGRSGRAWVEPDHRPTIDADTVAELQAALDEELAGRMPVVGHLVVDPAVYDVAIPLSGKGIAPGFRVMPRGSRSPIPAGHLRFFVYWKQKERRTDFDLSALLLDENFASVGQLSYTSLSGYGGVHSGDITSAPNGASEFIDLDLSRVQAAYIVPQVNVYDGEGFDEVQESFFGFMTRTAEQVGKPFEARTVRMRSDLRGTGRVALPLLFGRGKDGSWSATWMNLFMRGMSWRNQVEANRMSSALLASTINRRRYLTVRYLTDLMGAKAGRVSQWRDGLVPDGPVTFVGLERPDGLPDGSEAFTLERLSALVPA
jgi:hypothetical protein